MANVFVNPGWNTNDDPITVYVSGDLVYNDSGHGGTEATCYSTFEEAVTGSSSGGTIYIYNSTASPLSLLAPTGEYCPQSTSFVINKTLYVRAGTFRLSVVQSHHTGFVISNKNTLVDFGVSNSVIVDADTSFVVSYGANFQLGSTGSSTSVSLQNSGTVSVTTGIGEEAAPSNFYAGNTSVTNTGEIEVIGSSFSVASVTNTGTFKVEGTSKLEIGMLSGTITLNKENVTLNASNITGGSLSATAYGAIFTGANTLNGVALNATGKTVTVGNTASLTVGGTSSLKIGTLSGTIRTDANALTTLNASSITNGTISAQNNLAFTGANTLNGITLDASGKTVTVGTAEGDSLTVGGTSTLNIGTLDGEIKTASNTTLQNSSITGGGANGGTITAQGAITVNNSMITSSKFTATTVNGVDFYGENTLDGVTLETGTSTYEGFVYINGTLTIKGKSTLKTPGLLGTRTINLDGAEIVDSSILGNNGAGGTLVVESGKSATFSTTGTNSNDFGKTSINNSGTINVNGLLSLSTTTGTINNSGTINVNGRLTTGAITNTNGTIALNGATVSSTISGGSITTSNTGTVTVDDSTISSSAFTATADEVIFYYRNTLNGVTLDATGKAVTVNGTLTVKGTSTLNATNITGGTISAQDNLTFTGTNTLKNGVTLDATGMTTTVTIGNDDEIADSLTVEGTNTLNIGTLNGTIKTDADALTTLNASNITGGSISAQGNLTFTGANTLNGITLDATDKTVTVNGTLTVGGTSTLKIGTLNGEIKTGSAGTTLTGSDINGGTITALGTLTFANYTDLRNITLDAHDQTVDTGYSLWLGGAITLKIGTLISSILLDEDTTFTNSTISNGNDSSRLYIYGGKAVTFAGANTIFDAKVHATGRITNDGSITVKSNDDKGELTVYRIENSGSITVGSAGSANEAADACSLTGTLLNNGGTITVIGGENQSNRSLLDAAYITNGNNNYHTGKMSLTNAVLNATTLTNYGRGEFDPGPPTSQAAITISNSTVSLEKDDGTGALTNGAANNTSATIEFNNSTVTADSVTNYGIDNGTGGNTGKVGFEMTDSTFTVNNTFTNHGWIYVNNSTLQATSLVNNGNRFYVYGTSTLNIGTLTGRIDIINGNDTDSLLTLNNSHITGKVNDDGSLVSSIYVSNPLTFTGTNTLTNTQFYAPYAGKTVTVDSGATLTVGGTSTLNIGTLDGTITVADGATLSNSTVGGTITVDNNTTTTLKDTAVGGTVIVKSGATLTLDGVNAITTLDLSATDAAVTMDWQDQLSFTGFSGDYEGKLTINVDNYSIGDYSKPILDYTGNGEWTKEMYEMLLTNETWSTDRYEFEVRNNDLYINLKEIIIDHGTYDTVSVLDGLPVKIGEETGSTTLFEKGVLGGADTTVAAGSSDTPVEQGIDVSITGGTFKKLIAGGSLINLENVDDEYYVSGGTQAVSISGGKIENTVAAGDRLQKGILHRVGDLDMEITGGTFTSVVSGGMMNVIADTQSGFACLDGDIELKITGGTFSDNCWIYGGNVSSNKATISANSTIKGSVTITIDAADVADEGIVLSHIIVGSHGNGHIEGKVQADKSLLGTKIVFLGDGVDDDSAVVFAKNKDNKIVGELWGSSSGDFLNPSTKQIDDSVVTGNRVLSFMGFNGQLDCANIRAFSKIEIKNRIKTENNETSTIKSTVTLDNANFNLSGVDTWEFDCGSTLSGNFTNSLAGDTLNLWGFSDIAASQVLMTDTLNTDERNVFNGFIRSATCNGLAAIMMDGTAVSDLAFADNAYTFSAADISYKLSLETSETSTSMILTRTQIIA